VITVTKLEMGHLVECDNPFMAIYVRDEKNIPEVTKKAIEYLRKRNSGARQSTEERQ